MCTICGCSAHEIEITPQADVGKSYDHGEPVAQYQQPAGDSHSNREAELRMLKLAVNVLDENRKYAEQNRRYLRPRGVRMLSLVSSPGAGKTTLLTRSIGDLRNCFAISVIEGDQQTNRDAERIAAMGVEVVQINTGKACHLDAMMVGRALEELPLEKGGILFVENVGNLVCPAEFDLGEEKRVVMLSVTEGDDKPLKYPNIFASSDLMIVTKSDLSPYVDFDADACTEYAKRLRSSIEMIKTSAKTGEGLRRWYDWLLSFYASAHEVKNVR